MDSRCWQARSPNRIWSPSLSWLADNLVGEARPRHHPRLGVRTTPDQPADRLANPPRHQPPRRRRLRWRRGPLLDHRPTRRQHDTPTTAQTPSTSPAPANARNPWPGQGLLERTTGLEPATLTWAMRPCEGPSGRVCPCGRRCVERALAAGHRFRAQSCPRRPSVAARTAAYHEVVGCHAPLPQEAARPARARLAHLRPVRRRGPLPCGRHRPRLR